MTTAQASSFPKMSERRRVHPACRTVIAAVAPLVACQSPPSSWPVAVVQDCADAASSDAFHYSDEAVFRHIVRADGPCLALVDAADYQPPVRSPRAIALLRDVAFGDFDLECELLQTGRDYGHRDMCVFFGFASPQQFYYVHLAPKPDAHAHNVFRVHDAPRVALANVPANGIDWGRDRWHHVRIERRLQDGSIRVYWDHGAAPILQARCRELGWGRIGFGSFDDPGCIRNLIVRAPAHRTSVTADPFAR